MKLEQYLRKYYKDHQIFETGRVDKNKFQLSTFDTEASRSFNNFGRLNR